MHTLSIAAFVLGFAATVTGYVSPRKETPPSYAAGYLEPYQTYHTRYLAIGCQYKHQDVHFFNACCHPMLANETLESARPSYCAPSSSASASASAAEPTSTVATPADGADSDDESDYDCEGDDEQDSTFLVASSTAHPSSSSASPTARSSTEKPAQTSSSTQAAPTVLNDISTAESEVFTGGYATYFYQNGVAGACGTVHSDYDWIVALDQEKYGNSGERSQYCGRTVSVTANGKTLTATVADDCPTCDNGNSLDMSVGFFEQFYSLNVGIFSMEWQFD